MDTWPECQTVGARLKWVRERKLGMTADELVAALGERWSRRSVYRYESDERVPDASYAGELCVLANMGVTWVVTGLGTPFDVETEASPSFVEGYKKALRDVSAAMMPLWEATEPENRHRLSLVVGGANEEAERDPDARAAAISEARKPQRTQRSGKDRRRSAQGPD